MSVNVSGLNSTVFYGVNSALHLLYFVALPLPTIVLCAVGVVALLLAKDIEWKMRVALINVLIPDAISSLAGFFVNIGYPVRVFSSWDASCFAALSSYIVGVAGNFIFTPFFSVVVFVLVKYDAKRFKWWVIATYLILAWATLVVLGALIFVDPEENVSLSINHGICAVDYSGTTFLLVLTAIMVVITVVGLCVVFAFSIRTYCSGKSHYPSLDLLCSEAGFHHSTECGRSYLFRFY